MKKFENGEWIDVTVKKWVGDQWIEVVPQARFPEKKSRLEELAEELRVAEQAENELNTKIATLRRELKDAEFELVSVKLNREFSQSALCNEATKDLYK